MLRKILSGCVTLAILFTALTLIVPTVSAYQTTLLLLQDDMADMTAPSDTVYQNTHTAIKNISTWGLAGETVAIGVAAANDDPGVAIYSVSGVNQVQFTAVIKDSDYVNFYSADGYSTGIVRGQDYAQAFLGNDKVGRVWKSTNGVLYAQNPNTGKWWVYLNTFEGVMLNKYVQCGLGTTPAAPTAEQIAAFVPYGLSVGYSLDGTAWQDAGHTLSSVVFNTVAGIGTLVTETVTADLPSGVSKVKVQLNETLYTTAWSAAGGYTFATRSDRNWYNGMLDVKLNYVAESLLTDDMADLTAPAGGAYAYNLTTIKNMSSYNIPGEATGIGLLASGLNPAMATYDVQGVTRVEFTGFMKDTDYVNFTAADGTLTRGQDYTKAFLGNNQVGRIWIDPSNSALYAKHPTTGKWWIYLDKVDTSSKWKFFECGITGNPPAPTDAQIAAFIPYGLTISYTVDGSTWVDAGRRVDNASFYTVSTTNSYTVETISANIPDGSMKVRVQLNERDKTITWASGALTATNNANRNYYVAMLDAKLYKAKYAFQEAVDSVKTTIAALPDATLITPASGPAIAAAQLAYDALSSAQKGYVTNASTLTAAKERFNRYLPTMLGAQIRSSGAQGLRYGTSVDLTSPEGSGYTIAGYGTVLISEAKWTANGKGELVKGYTGSAYREGTVLSSGSTAMEYGVTVVNIPVANYSSNILARSYIIYEKDGNQVIVYNTNANSVNGSKAILCSIREIADAYGLKLEGDE